MKARCPNDLPYGDRVCRNGYLWELTYSEMAPPDSRQNTGIKCPVCNDTAEALWRWQDETLDDGD